MPPNKEEIRRYAIECVLVQDGIGRDELALGVIADSCDGYGPPIGTGKLDGAHGTGKLPPIGHRYREDWVLSQRWGKGSSVGSAAGDGATILGIQFNEVLARLSFSSFQVVDRISYESDLIRRVRGASARAVRDEVFSNRND